MAIGKYASDKLSENDALIVLIYKFYDENQSFFFIIAKKSSKLTLPSAKIANKD